MPIETRALRSDFAAEAGWLDLSRPQGARFVYRRTWCAGDLVIWDNRCTMHRGRPHDETQARDPRRPTTLDTTSTLDQAA